MFGAVLFGVVPGVVLFGVVVCGGIVPGVVELGAVPLGAVVFGVVVPGVVGVVCGVVDPVGGVAVPGVCVVPGAAGVLGDVCPGACPAWPVEPDPAAPGGAPPGAV